MCECKAKVFVIGKGEMQVNCSNFFGMCMKSAFKTIGKEQAVAIVLGKPKNDVVSVEIVDNELCDKKVKYNG